MLQAKNGRQLNLAAQSIKAFFSESKIEVAHGDALRLVGRLLGFPNYEAAQASLDGKGKGRATTAATWRDLAHAIGTLDESQLDLPVFQAEVLTDGTGTRFSRAAELLLANDKVVGPRGADFDAHQPILLVEQYVPGQESDAAYRVAMQFESASDLPGSQAEWHIERKGIQEAISYLNHFYDINISLGEFVIYSEAEQGFWNADFGWVSNKASATGVDKMLNAPSFPLDAELVRYVDAVDVEDANGEPGVMDDKIHGTPVSRYSWPARFEAIWSEVRTDALPVCYLAMGFLKENGYQVELTERLHGNNAGREIALAMHKDGVYGGEMVLALANFHASSPSLPCAAGMNWFFSPPDRDALFGSILRHEDNRKPFATEAGHFKGLVSLVSARGLAQFMDKMFEPKQDSK